MGVGKLPTKDLIRVVTCRICLFSLYSAKYMIFITYEMLYGRIGVTFMYNFASRKYDLRGYGLQQPKIGGGQRKQKGRQT